MRKKNIILLILLIAVNLKGTAQITITPTQTLKQPGVVYKGPWVTIFEKQLYGGIKKTFQTNTQNVDLGFRADTISLKIAAGYMAFLTINCQDIMYEKMYNGNTNFIPLPPGAICGLRIEKAADFTIDFDGILTEIHNNDCKKFYGLVKYKIFELNERNERIYYNLNSRDGGGYENWVYTIPKTSNAVERSLYNIADFYVADRDYINGVITDPNRYKPYMRTVRGHVVRNKFKINEAAYRNKKVFLEVITKIGSHHKGCDLCTDYTNDVEMQREEIKVYNLNATAWDIMKFSDKLIQVGPFRQTRNHTTYLNFKLSEVY